MTPAAERVFHDVAKQQGWGEAWLEIERQAVKNLVPNPVGRIGRVDEVGAAPARASLWRAGADSAQLVTAR